MCSEVLDIYMTTLEKKHEEYYVCISGRIIVCKLDKYLITWNKESAQWQIGKF